MEACNVILCGSSVNFSITPLYPPSPPYNLARNDTDTNVNSVSFSWSLPLKLGGGPILSYRISWDEGKGGSMVIKDAAYIGSLLLFTVSSGITAGTIYAF